MLSFCVGYTTSREMPYKRVINIMTQLNYYLINWCIAHRLTTIRMQNHYVLHKLNKSVFTKLFFFYFVDRKITINKFGVLAIRFTVSFWFVFRSLQLHRFLFFYRRFLLFWIVCAKWTFILEVDRMIIVLACRRWRKKNSPNKLLSLRRMYNKIAHFINYSFFIVHTQR